MNKISQKLNCFCSEFKFHWCNFNGSTNETKLLWKYSAKDWKFCTQFHPDSYCIDDKWWNMAAFLPQIWLSNEGSTTTRTLMWSLQHHTTVAMVYAVLYLMQDSSFYTLAKQAKFCQKPIIILFEMLHFFQYSKNNLALVTNETASM